MTLSTDNYKAAVAERSRIEHERDYDALTGLYSRCLLYTSDAADE